MGKMSDHLIELGESMCRHMPNKDIDYWMELIVNGDKKIETMAEKFLKEDKHETVAQRPDPVSS